MTAPNLASSLSPAAQAALNDHFVQAVERLDVERVKRLLDQGLDASLVRVLPSPKPGGASTRVTLMDVAWWAGLNLGRASGTEVPTDRVDAVVQALVEHGGDPNACAWHVWLNSPSLYLTFVRAGAALNREESLDYHQPLVWWYTQFHRPIDPEVLDAMLERGLDVHQQVHGVPLLAHCLGACDTVAAERLVQAGAHAREFSLPIDRIVGEHLPLDERTRRRVDHLDARAAKASTLAWWVAHEQALLCGAMDDGGPTTEANERRRPRL